ncbi:hypothetical protein ACOSQ4_011686 [Xanthoceras sorbifolium]
MEPDEIASRCAKLSLSEDDGPIARLDDDLKEKGLRRMALSLVGKVISNRDINREAFKNTMVTIWRTKQDVEIELIGSNLFVFCFGCPWDRKRVLEGGPWSFDRSLLVLKEATGIGRVAELDFTFTPFWVQVYNLPLSCMNKDAGIFLGGLVGTVIEIDGGQNGDCVGKFLRVRVLIDVTKPLKRGLRFEVGDGEMCSALLCYERLPNFCFFCGCMGHLLRECQSNNKGLLDHSSLKFGAWMRAPAASKSKFLRNSSSGPVASDSVSVPGGVGTAPVEVDLGVSGKKKGDDSVVTDSVPVPNSTVLAPLVSAVSEVSEISVADIAADIIKEAVMDCSTIIINSDVGTTSEGFSTTRPDQVTEDSVVVSSPSKKRWKRRARVRFQESIDPVSDCGGKRAVVIHRDYSGSDHRALIIDGIRKCSGARSGLNRVGSRFHFEQAWADEEECRVIVKRAWDLRVGRDNISCLQNSLDAVAVNLSDWNKKRRKASVEEVRSLRDELERFAPQVSHLFFADDSLIFLRASEVECVGLKKILDCYERASGQSSCCFHL